MDDIPQMDSTKAMENERAGFDAPGPETKGGGLKGGPKRWTGRGPAPARHIPWPEIFKHHISLIEGHLKMTDMVRKHTVEGSGNWRTIMDVVERTKEMLYQSKKMSRQFVAPADHRFHVPVGSSSVSMYPGYSPADHVYGKAAEEYGKAVGLARANGEEIPQNPEMEYQINQKKGGAKTRRSLAEIKADRVAAGKPVGPMFGRAGESGAALDPAMEQNTANESSPEAKNPYFVIDTEPTPLPALGAAVLSTNGDERPIKKAKKTYDEDLPVAPVEEKKHKKAKKTHDGHLPAAPGEVEDISERVDAKLQEKEEKRKRKEEKKRKRESEKGEAAETDSAAASQTTTVGALNGDVEKPKKKKKKERHSEDEQGLVDRTVDKKRKFEGDVESDQHGKNPRKRETTHELQNGDSKGEPHNAEAPTKEKKKKKGRKEKKA